MRCRLGRAIAIVPDVLQGEQGHCHALMAFWNYAQLLLSQSAETPAATREGRPPQTCRTTPDYPLRTLQGLTKSWDVLGRAVAVICDGPIQADLGR